MLSSSPSHKGSSKLKRPSAIELKPMRDSSRVNLFIECKKALCWLYEVPVKVEDDPIAFLPKEADYYEDDKIRTLAASQYNESSGLVLALLKSACCFQILRHLLPFIIRGDTKFSEPKLDIARGILEKAWEVAVKNPGDSLDKVNILCAASEVALRKSIIYATEGVESIGKEFYEDARYHYARGLRMLQKMGTEGNQRIADINAKIAICYDFCDQRDSAISYYEDALSLYRARLELLPDGREKDKLNNIIHILQAKASVTLEIYFICEATDF
ncbi:hypothetical protein Tsubulata_044824 [Turnera subulata]|uniref:Uncharacterized protein n=1 Tax=Turnera subulata TaxID=218843 RepID=A0A9Q0FBD0_9ROSI|nr:hypothetical protein Tsubulata_044824 [Turnera subulata]